MKRNVEQRLGLPVFAVRKLPAFELDCLLVIDKSDLGHITIVVVFQKIESELTRAVRAHLEVRFGVDMPVLLEQPKQASFGELAVPVAFQLARQLKQAPRAIAQTLVSELGEVPGIASFEVAGNGYINVRLDRQAYGYGLLEGRGGSPERATEGKIIVEHTNINPNKAAHIGHLRNAILGDTFVRMLRSTGYPVEVQNYIDNTGVQVADVVVGFLYLDPKTPAELEALVASPRFDYTCWDLYARVSTYYQEHPEALKDWRAADAAQHRTSGPGRVSARC